MLCLLLLPFSVAVAENRPDFCAEETSRLLGVTQVEVSVRSELQMVCPAGNLERVNLTSAVGSATVLSFDFQQSAFDQAIFHLDLVDADQRPVEWITASPQAGEIDRTSSARIELAINPPLDLISSVQHITVGVTIHDGTKSWSRELDLQITVGEEQSLFKDQFEIDPVIGQFSQQAPQPRRIHLISARPAAGH